LLLAQVVGGGASGKGCWRLFTMVSRGTELADCKLQRTMAVFRIAFAWCWL
jgi:hypothetical protein